MKKFKALRVLITVIMVILGISGIGWFTWHLGKMFVGLVSSAPPSVQEEIEPTSSEILSLPKITLWTCQAGVFKEKKNADLMVDSLRLKGWKAGIITEEPYTIMIGAFDKKEKAVQFGNLLAEEGITTWVKEESFPALNYKVSGKNVKKITVLLTVANSLLVGTDRDDLKNELAGDIEFLLSGGYPSDFEKFHDLLVHVLSEDYKNEQLNFSYQQDLLDVFIEYKLITTKYFKNDK